MIEFETKVLETIPRVKNVKSFRFKTNEDVDFKPGLIEDIPYDDNYFDVVTSSMMTHHLPLSIKKKGFQEVEKMMTEYFYNIRNRNHTHIRNRNHTGHFRATKP